MDKRKEPLISIVVPVYNVSAYLNDSLQTVVSQTYRNLEIILIDDGSTDDSGKLCDIWADKDQRIRVIHQSNMGLSAARNAGLDIASGAYILFADSDDLLSPDLCSVLMEAMLPGVNIAVCDCEHIFREQPYSFEVKRGVQVMSAECAIRQLWYQTSFLPSAWAKLYRRNIFDNHRFTVGLLFEDVDLMHELFWSAGKIAYNASRLYGYVHRENSITTRSFSVREFDILKIAEKILQFAQDKPTLMPAAQAYTITAAFRIYLNAPREPAFSEGIAYAEKLIRTYGKAVLWDRNIRRKNRCALYLYFCCNPLLRYVYRYVDRWKA